MKPANGLSKPTEKILSVLSCLNDHQVTTLSLHEISRISGVPKATLFRILTTLEEHGYVNKTSQKEYIANFRIVNLSNTVNRNIDLIRRTMTELMAKDLHSVEILTVSGHDLFWYDKMENAEQGLLVKAKTGARRDLYELDAPSRLYLRFLLNIGIEEVVNFFEINSFFLPGHKGTKIPWTEAEKVIEKTDVNGVAFDRIGNAHGIRRFAILLSPGEREFGFILSVAEPAIDRNNTEEHIARVVSLLGECKKTMGGQIK